MSFRLMTLRRDAIKTSTYVQDSFPGVDFCFSQNVSKVGFMCPLVSLCALSQHVARGAISVMNFRSISTISKPI